MGPSPPQAHISWRPRSGAMPWCSVRQRTSPLQGTLSAAEPLIFWGAKTSQCVPAMIFLSRNTFVARNEFRNKERRLFRNGSRLGAPWDRRTRCVCFSADLSSCLLYGGVPHTPHQAELGTCKWEGLWLHGGPGTGSDKQRPHRVWEGNCELGRRVQKPQTGTRREQARGLWRQVSVTRREVWCPRRVRSQQL